MNPVLKNTPYYSTPRRQFSILINNSNLEKLTCMKLQREQFL